ncbi:C-type lectin domain family 4 member E [Channa argus]|uniref:C-type lectin domain family 4 member E n=1 Tax=Channa argus TaxID=215402 RepID=A0A6G1QXM0_CHAAH|nr:C-type lectin domain family 4 member E [Channa argus]KAK2920727.1 hypothetical protein Q8A73_000212 [Channa argus]
MSTPGSPPTSEGMYSKLIDDEGTRDVSGHRPDVAQRAHAFLPVRLSGPGPYRLATVCLAVLCAVLLISIIAVAARDKTKPQSGGEATLEAQKQTLDANMTALTATIHKLQQEKATLEAQKQTLEANVTAQTGTIHKLQQEKATLEAQKQTLEANVTAQTGTILKLRQEKAKLQKEKEELLAKLAATKAPEVIKPTPAPITCPLGWNLFSNSCYFISTVSNNWPESQNFCQTQGAHLAIIHTAEEQTFVWNLLPRGHWNAYWFGITDEHTEDQWKWVDGTPLVGGFWEVGEPNNHIDEDCGYIVKTLVLERVPIRSWYDAPCSMYRPFICEKEMSTTQ